MDRPKIELLPHEWTSDRAKPHEPVFGPGLPQAMAYAIGWLITFSGLYFFTH